MQVKGGFVVAAFVFVGKLVQRLSLLSLSLLVSSWCSVCIPIALYVPLLTLSLSIPRFSPLVLMSMSCCLLFCLSIWCFFFFGFLYCPPPPSQFLSLCLSLSLSWLPPCSLLSFVLHLVFVLVCLSRTDRQQRRRDRGKEVKKRYIYQEQEQDHKAKTKTEDGFWFLRFGDGFWRWISVPIHIRQREQNDPTLTWN